MLNFRAATPNKSSKPTFYLARYIDKKWYIKSSNILIPIHLDDLKSYTTFYSTPENDRHDPWTKRVISKGAFNATLESWTPLYHGMKLTGHIKNGVFIINKMYHAK